MPTRRRKGYAPEQVGVKEVRTDELHPNPHNPRLLFDKEPLDTLRESIAKVGILVPLTVYLESRRERYVILDGQRRWMCAKELDLPTVPVNRVHEPTLVQNIVTMFQIHKLREDWELMPTALKLEVLMDKMQEKNAKKLAEHTGLDPAVVQRCKKLLSYPKKYQDMMLDPDPEKRVKADFFIELHVVRNDRFVNSLKWYKQDQFTAAMLQRHLSGGLRAVTDFRIVKQHINNARRAKQERAIGQRLREFTENADLSVQHLELTTASALADAREVQRDVERLALRLRTLDVDACYGEESFWKALESLANLIRKKLAASGRRAKQ